jgi:hypothetical protein
LLLTFGPSDKYCFSLKISCVLYHPISLLIRKSAQLSFIATR